MTTIEKIRAEIERRKNNAETLRERNICIDILSFLDTLQEPEKGLDVTEFCRPVDPDIAKSVADHWFEMLEEDKTEIPKNQSEVDLDDEIERRYDQAKWGYVDGFGSVCMDKGQFTRIARHFYELGCRRTAEKYDEIEYNRQRASGSSEIPNDLEEAAEAFAFKSIDEVILYGCTLSGRRACFIAGAKWQAERLLSGRPLPEDTVLFNKGVEEGKRLMMEDAVEGEVVQDLKGVNRVKSFGKIPEGLHFGDKVRIIIIKD